MKTLGGRMAPSRRAFIKFVVVGSVAAGCPVDETLLAAPESPLRISNAELWLSQALRLD